MASKRYSLVETEGLVKEFYSILEHIEIRESIRFTWRDIMFNKSFIGSKEEPKVSTQGLLYKYHKQFRAFYMAVYLYQLLTKNPNLFEQEKLRVPKIIELYDPELSKRLRNFYLPSIDKEILELNKYINDVSRWFLYRLTNRIEFFIQQLNLYLKGGVDKTNGGYYLGIISHFKDVVLVKQMFEIPEIKKLWTYKQEIEFFEWAKNIILRSLREEGKWEGFYEFYNNLRKKKNYIKMVREKFGNEEFADLLERLHKNIHEAPEIWEKELTKISYELNDQTYQNRKVVEPAKEALARIFEARIRQLKTTKNNALVESKKLFAEILRTSKRKLLKQWDKEKIEYESKEEDVLLDLLSFKESCEKILDKIDRRKKYRRYKKILNNSLEGDLFLSRFLKQFIQNENKEVLLERIEGISYYSFYKRFELAKAEENSYDDIEYVEESDVQELKNLIQRGKNIILPDLDKLLSYIYGKVNQYLLAEAKEVINQYPKPKLSGIEKVA